VEPAPDPGVSVVREVSHRGAEAGFLSRERGNLVTILIRAIELAVSAPFQALAAIRAAKTYEHDPYDDWAEHDEDR
jgi:hypothetical protein